MRSLYGAPGEMHANDKSWHAPLGKNNQLLKKYVKCNSSPDFPGAPRRPRHILSIYHSYMPTKPANFIFLTKCILSQTYT